MMYMYILKSTSIPKDIWISAAEQTPPKLAQPVHLSTPKRWTTLCPFFGFFPNTIFKICLLFLLIEPCFHHKWSLLWPQTPPFFFLPLVNNCQSIIVFLPFSLWHSSKRRKKAAKCPVCGHDAFSKVYHRYEKITDASRKLNRTKICFCPENERRIKPKRSPICNDCKNQKFGAEYYQYQVDPTTNQFISCTCPPHLRK